MKNSKIDSLAIVEPGAQIGNDVTIEPFAVVKANVILHDRVVIKSHAYIDGFTTVGADTVIWPGAVIGTKPQDLKYRGEKTYVEIGKNCQIREYVTVNSSCGKESVVKIGDNCLLMANCHVAHNCVIGNNVIMANSSMLAGHVKVEDFAIIGGFTPVHQYTKIGCYSMVGGFSRVPLDVPPYIIGGDVPFRVAGLNRVGLRRHQFPLEVRLALAKAFRITYRMNLRLSEALKKIEEEVFPYPEVRHWLDFCTTSKRGLIDLGGITKKSCEESAETADEIESFAENG